MVGHFLINSNKSCFWIKHVVLCEGGIEGINSNKSCFWIGTSTSTTFLGNRLTVTKVVFESAVWFRTLCRYFRLTVTKVVFEFEMDEEVIKKAED